MSMSADANVEQILTQLNLLNVTIYSTTTNYYININLEIVHSISCICSQMQLTPPITIPDQA